MTTLIRDRTSDVWSNVNSNNNGDECDDYQDNINNDNKTIINNIIINNQ